MKGQEYTAGKHESIKFAALRDPYYKGLNEILSLGYETEDFIHHFPCFVGHQTLLRFLNFYEFYKMTSGVAGHIGEVGVYKAACSLFFAKLVKLFEPHSLTVVHGFDTFEGNKKGAGYDKGLKDGGYKESYDRVFRLVKAQGMETILHLHKMDVINSMARFLKQNQSIQFKLVVLDAGYYQVVKTVLPLLWQRMTPGGVVILDQYNFEAAPGETVAVRECLPDVCVRVLTPSWMPTAYIVKPSK